MRGAVDGGGAMSADHERLLAKEVFIGGANHQFGELTVQDAQSHADELRSMAGWGPTMRVAPVARAWRELAITMEREGAATVGQLDEQTLSGLVERLWVVMPGGPLMR